MPVRLQHIKSHLPSRVIAVDLFTFLSLSPHLSPSGALLHQLWSFPLRAASGWGGVLGLGPWLLIGSHGRTAATEGQRSWDQVLMGDFGLALDTPVETRLPQEQDYVHHHDITETSSKRNDCNVLTDELCHNDHTEYLIKRPHRLTVIVALQDLLPPLGLWVSL